MAAVGTGRGKQVAVAALGQAQAAAQFGHGGRKVAHRQVGRTQAGKQAAHLFLAEPAIRLDPEHAAGEIGTKRVGRIKVAVGMEFVQSVTDSRQAVGTGLQQGRIGLVEVSQGERKGRNGPGLFGQAKTETPVATGAAYSGLACKARTHTDQKLATLATDGYDVQFANTGQTGQRTVEVEHRREFNHHQRGPARQQGEQAGGIGFAVGDGNGLASRTVAPGGVEIDQVPRLAGRQVATVTLDNARIGHAEQRKVVAGQLAEYGVSLHIQRLSEPAGQKNEIDAETAGQIGHLIALRQQAAGHSGLVAGRFLARTLLDGELRRIEQAIRFRLRALFFEIRAFYFGPGGHLATQFLPPFYLNQCHGHVYASIAGCLKSQGAHVVGAMGQNKLAGFRIHLLVFWDKDTQKSTHTPASYGAERPKTRKERTKRTISTKNRTFATYD